MRLNTTLYGVPKSLRGTEKTEYVGIFRATRDISIVSQDPLLRYAIRRGAYFITNYSTSTTYIGSTMSDLLLMLADLGSTSNLVKREFDKVRYHLSFRSRLRPHPLVLLLRVYYKEGRPIDKDVILGVL